MPIAPLRWRLLYQSRLCCRQQKRALQAGDVSVHLGWNLLRFYAHLKITETVARLEEVFLLVAE